MNTHSQKTLLDLCTANNLVCEVQTRVRPHARHALRLRRTPTNPFMPVTGHTSPGSCVHWSGADESNARTLVHAPGKPSPEPAQPSSSRAPHPCLSPGLLAQSTSRMGRLHNVSHPRLSRGALAQCLSPAPLTQAACSKSPTRASNLDCSHNVSHPCPSPGLLAQSTSRMGRLHNVSHPRLQLGLLALCLPPAPLTWTACMISLRSGPGRCSARHAPSA